MISPILSIVIANYNYGRFLETAIRSVVEQDGFNRCELIVVDGGSTDNSVEVIKQYGDKISWWVSESDKGQSDAFNKGFARARGKYLTWLNADDVLLQGALRVIVDNMERYPNVQWFAGATAYLADDGAIKTATVPLGNVVPRLLGIPAWMRVSGPSSFFSRELFSRAGGFDVSLRYVMDIDLWMRFTNLGAKLKVMDRYLWGFRLHEESKTSSSLTTGSINKKFAKERMEIRRRNRVGRTEEKFRFFCKRFCGVISFGYLKRLCFMKDYKSTQSGDVWICG